MKTWFKNKQYREMQIQEETLLCSDLIPFPYENPPCEIEALTKLRANEKCHPVLLDIEDYNVQKLILLDKNKNHLHQVPNLCVTK
jgi:hypothetical protein